MLRFIFTILFAALSFKSFALTYVLDTEVNATFRNLLNQLDEKTADTINLYLGISPDMNAFVTEDRNMFIYSGLIEKADNAAELQGVLAHELAHVKAGHIEQGKYAQELAKKKALATTVLGIGTAAAGSADAGAAVLMSGQAEAISGILKHSRTSESEADNIAAQMLEDKGFSLEGMVSFFRKLHSHTFLRYGALPPYLLTHPLPSQRVQTLNDKLEKQPLSNTKVPTYPFDRLKAKVYALSHTPAQTLRKYYNDDSEPATYAKAIAKSLQGEEQNALAYLDKLSPTDPFYIELRGDIALDFGRLEDALKNYSEAQKQLKSPLISFKLAQTEKALGHPEKAISHAQAALSGYSNFPPIWQLLGVLYGQTGQKVKSHISLAEAALRNNDKKAFEVHLKLAEKFITPETPQHLKLQLDSLKSLLKKS